VKPEIKALWIHALRSGRYEQAHRALYDAGAHCCLGVLCDIHEGVKWTGFAMGTARYNEAGASDYLPKPLAEHLGIGYRPSVELPWNWQDKLPEGVISSYTRRRLETWRNNNGLRVMLHQLNDEYGLSFEEIAVLLEHFEVS
jgi:hypothetical protein